MKKFILGVSSFIFMIAALYTAFLVFLFFTPPTPRAATSYFFAEIKKDSLLLNEPSPRIIFLGGSNLSFGLNSQMIRDSIMLSPINAGLSARLGIKYMLENTLRYVRPGDLIILVPEYQLFYRDWDWGSEELLHSVIDTNKSNVKLLSLKQAIRCMPFVFNFVISKFKRSEYIESSGVYSVYSFNQYGDACLHWNLPKKEFVAPGKIAGTYNPRVMTEIKNYSRIIQGKGASLFISYSGYQDISFLKSEKAIRKIEQEYIASGLTILGTPERYMMPDSVLFDTQFHLTKAGADYRTQLLIEDIRTQITHGKEFVKTAEP